MLVKMNLVNVSVSSLLVLNQDNKLPAQVEKMCFPLLLSSLPPFLSLHFLSSPPMRKQEAG